MNRDALRCLCAALLLCVSGVVEAQTLYKCVQANGRVVYQQEKCEDPNKQSTVRPPDPVAPKSEAEQKASADKGARAAALQMGQVSQMLADISLCVNEAKGFDEKHASIIQEWKARNGEQVTKFYQDADAQAQAQARMEAERTRFAADKNRNAFAEHCDRLGASLRAGGGSAAPKK